MTRNSAHEYPLTENCDELLNFCETQNQNTNTKLNI